MDPFLLHCLLLAWTSLGAARHLTVRIAERLIAAALLAWGNIVATSLLLSAFNLLDDRFWFLGLSAVITGLTCLGVRRFQAVASDGEPVASNPSRWLAGAFGLTLALLAGASFGLAYAYEPGNADSLTYHLPRVMYYLGQGSLNHFAATDPRQTQLPFNYNLLQLVVMIHGAPLQSLNFFNLCAWGVGGMAIYRLCRLCGTGANAALITCWLALVTTGVLAQANTTTPEPAVAAALLAGAVFSLQWRQTRQSRDAVLTGLAMGLAAGSDARAALLVIGGLLGWLLWVTRQPDTKVVLRPWVLPLLLAAGLGLPFAFINLVHGKLGIDAVFGASPGGLGRDFWSGWWPLHAPGTGAILGENNAGFGLTGLLFLIAAAYGALRLRAALGWFVWAALGWILAVLLFHRLSLYPRDFMPGLLLLSPCVARLLEAGAFARTSGRLLLAVIALTSLWSAGIYLCKNSNRPLAPLFQASFVQPGLPTLPLLVEHRLTGQPQINVDTDATDESIFPFMARSRGQRFTFRRELDLEAFNLLSRPITGRNAAFSALNGSSGYVMVPIESKRTAGVEFLATIGQGASARDYLGLAPRSGFTAPIISNRALLVTLYRQPGSQVRIKLAGLNAQDQARLVVELRHDDRSTTALATFATDGETTVTINQPFRLVVFRALDTATGQEIGSAAIQHLAPAVVDPMLHERTKPSSASSLFVTDLVQPNNVSLIVCQGLLPTEGPFPQWDIPFIRWARVPLVRLEIPPTAGLARLQLSFSFRLHVRKQGHVELFFNDKLVQRYTLEDQLNWRDETLELSPQAGTNVIEFRDATHKTVPDWADYLDRYPDVKNYLLAEKLPLEAGAAAHFESNGRAEGRTLTMRETTELEPAYESYYFMFRNLRLEGFKSP